MTKDSEYRAYDYIKKVLNDIGWNTKNPSRGGSVYYQGEFYDHSEFLKSALGLKKPENIICISHATDIYYWIVEAKASHKDHEKAVQEAIGYAEQVNDFKSGRGKNDLARFATGISGTEENSFLVSTHYWNKQEWCRVLINDQETTGFLSPQQCQDILKADSHDIAQFDDDPKRFLIKANSINKTLRENSVPVGERAKFMGALLLALAEEGQMIIHDSPIKMIREINGSIKQVLAKHDKHEFYDILKLHVPAKEDNQLIFRKAIIETLQHLREMNIRSVINSGDDALGKFYETFLRYANGATEMGIVLTPRHITKFAVDVFDITHESRIFDPSCGTGGFLVSAMDDVRNKLNGNKKEFTKFKENGIWGVEKEEPIYSLALVNMVFRGDGKSGLQNGDCFEHNFLYRDGKMLISEEQLDGAKAPFTHVLMNPPFKQKKPERDFVDYALNLMEEGGDLFAVLPAVVIAGQENEAWRKELLQRHTVKAVIKLDKSVFYPAQEGTYALILQAHRAQEIDDKIFMGILFDDDHRPRLSKMVSKHGRRDNVERMTADTKRSLLGKPVSDENIPHEQKTITASDLMSSYEFSPEAYIDNKRTDTLASISKRAITLNSAILQSELGTQKLPHSDIKREFFPLGKFIKSIEKPTVSALKDYAEGSVPVISATAGNNGIAEYKDVPENLWMRDCISISKTHNTMPCEAYWHPYNFAAIATVHLIKPTDEFANDIYLISYLCQSIAEVNAWRYDYARTVNLDELEVFLPVKENGDVDYATIRKESKKQTNNIFD